MLHGAASQLQSVRRPDVDDLKISRRFADVNGRTVHMRIMGNGPPALFVHSSPANSFYVVKDMEVVADSYTCFAFDTPGFGLSDALRGDELTVADLADALAETLDAIGMPPCPVFGTHTGASIALELGIRHPARVTGLVLDGLASFTQAEYDALFGEYFTKFPPDPLGGHYSSLWTRFRDQSTWFPWSARSPDFLNESDLTTPSSTHQWLTMYFDAADTYAPAYRAALSYRDGPAQVQRLSVPAIFTAIESDMLYPHLDRIAPVRADQETRRVGDSLADRRALTREGFERFGSPGPIPSLHKQLRSSTSVARQFVDIDDHQLLVRFMGDPERPTALIVHDVPGSGESVEAHMRHLSADHFVIAFDLPGCGETQPVEPCDIEAVAQLLWRGVDGLGRNGLHLFGVGFGSSVAVEMAAIEPERTESLTLDGLLLADEAERADLRAHFAPPITVEADGSHWFRTWQMIRDIGIWWPWYRPTRAALRRVEADFDAVSLHRRTCATMRQPGQHKDIVDAALDQDAVVRLRDYGKPVYFKRSSLNPLATAYGQRMRQTFPDAEWID